MKKIGLSLLFLLLPHITLAAATTPQWTGGYIGLLAGQGFAKSNTDVSIDIAPGDDAVLGNSINQTGKQTVTAQGFLAGIDAGYNWRVSPYILAGLETDLQTLYLGDRADSGLVSFPNDPANNYVIGTYSNINWLWTLRPRLGFICNNWLFYGTAGLALTQLNSNYYYQDSIGALASASINTTKLGSIFGAGMEVKLTERLSLKGEYLYAYFDKSNATATGATDGALLANSNFNYAANFKTHLVRLGINYFL